MVDINITQNLLTWIRTGDDEKIDKFYMEHHWIEKLDFAWLYPELKKFKSIRAFNLIGNMYFYGKYVEKNYENAFKNWNISAHLNNSHALYNLGSMYKYGHYVEKNYEKAFEYYQKSADLSNPMALNNLGLMYKNGEYVEQNYRKAFECFHKSASLGGVVALNNIKNLCYDSDNDVKNAAKKYLENSKYNKKSGKKDDIKEMEKILEQKNKLIKILRKKDVDKDKKIYKLENIIENLLMELDYTSEYQRRAIWEEKKID